jgi:hypothetical protein
MALSFRQIRPLLNTGTNAGSRWFSYIGLAIGVLLLLCSLQMYINIQQMLKENSVRKTGFDFISITKTITNETMGQEEKNLFNNAEVQELESQPFVEGVSPLIANQFRVQLSAGSIIPFQTDLFIETLENEFIDTVPPSFTWQQGQIDIPIIISSDFLEIYNVFAPGQGLPQVSQETASGIPILITCEGNGLEQTFRGHVVAFSDRINSVLVPKSFLDWANETFGAEKTTYANRLFIKAKDANNPDLLSFWISVMSLPTPRKPSNRPAVSIIGSPAIEIQRGPRAVWSSISRLLKGCFSSRTRPSSACPPSSDGSECPSSALAGRPSRAVMRLEI